MQTETHIFYIKTGTNCIDLISHLLSLFSQSGLYKHKNLFGESLLHI